MTKNYSPSSMDDILTAARARPMAIALPEFDDGRVQAAAELLIDWRVVSKIYPVFSQAELAARTPTLRHDLLKFLVPTPEPILAQHADSKLHEAGLLLAEGYVNSVLAGATHPTAAVIRAAIATVGVAPGLKTVSGAFLLERVGTNRTERLLYADCGVVIDPTFAQLCDIVKASVKTWRALSQDPPVLALLSFSTKGSATHPASTKMAELGTWVKTNLPDVKSDGELQFDAAYVRDIGLRKGADPEVAGLANIFIFPDLNAGNIAYKITERLGGFSAYGPILQGTGKIYSDLSRGASAHDIAISALINHRRSADC